MEDRAIVSMQLAEGLIRLCDYPVADILAALPPPSAPLWDNVQFRRNFYLAHRATRVIVFDWLHSAWNPGDSFIVLTSNSAPAALASAARACGEALAQRLDGKVSRLLLAELAPHASIPIHKDGGPTLVNVHRCHVPIVTHEDVVFRVDGVDYRLEQGVAYEFDNMRYHSVSNPTDVHRVHLICDIMPRELVI